MNKGAKWNGVLGVVLIFGIGVFALADDPKDLNCDFESGLGKWRGDGRLRTVEGGNKVCELKKKGKRTAEITHKIEIPGKLAFDIHYKVRAIPGSKNVKLRRAVRNAGGAGFSGGELVADGKWVEQKFGVKAGAGDRKSDRIIALVFIEGEGIIQIDDIRVVPRK